MFPRRLRRSRAGLRAPQARADGQILVLFVAGLVALIAIVGLVLDGGSAFAQRRQEQGVADLAAIAGATAYLNATGGATVRSAAADAGARAIAASNGYTHEHDATTISVTVTPTLYAATVRVDITKAHRNAFIGILGMPTWDVSVSAAAVSSNRPNGARGAMPLLFNAEAFPNAICDESAGACVPEVYQEPGAGNADVPQDATQFNWTIFCTANGNPCNANSDGVDDIIDGFGTDTTIDLGMEIGPLNAGSHTTLFNSLDRYIGDAFPVPIVNDIGEMVGFAYFHLTGVEGTSQKVIRGYFVSPVNADKLVVLATGPNARLDAGVFSIKLVD